MKNIQLFQNKKQRIEAGLERIERIQRIAKAKLGINLSKSQGAKIAIDSLIKEAKALESACIKWKNTRKDVALNEASRLYALADSISRNYQI
jgi:hypothetical protein